MKLGYVIIYVPDVLQVVEFYEKAFGLTRKFVHEGGDYAELATGDTALAFASETLRAANGVETLDNRLLAKPAGVEIALVTNDVQSAYDNAVSAGAAPLKKPEQKLWGQTVGYVRDLNGFLVEICSPVGA
jgi:lactoylglutathione lyase